MADVLHVSHESMSSTSTKFKQEADQFLTSVGELKKAADNLASVWQGSGSEGFQEQYINMNAGFEKTQEAITAIYMALDKTLEFYTESDSQVQNVWTGKGL